MNEFDPALFTTENKKKHARLSIKRERSEEQTKKREKRLAIIEKQREKENTKGETDVTRMSLSDDILAADCSTPRRPRKLTGYTRALYYFGHNYSREFDAPFFGRGDGGSVFRPKFTGDPAVRALCLFTPRRRWINALADSGNWLSAELLLSSWRLRWMTRENERTRSFFFCIRYCMIYAEKLNVQAEVVSSVKTNTDQCK